MGRRGQASCEWIALLCVVAGALVAVGTVVVHAVAAGLGPSNASDKRIGSPTGYDAATWALVRRVAPLVVFERGMADHPVDPRACRVRACALGDDPPLLFTHVVRRGATTYVQYWAYWPDSSWHGIAGRHADDWESFQVRVGADGRLDARASAHHGYTGQRIGPDLNVNQVRPQWVPARWRAGWTPWRGGYRVSKDSHAGFVRSADGGVRPVLVPLEPAALPQDYAIVPPWRKRVYADPESPAT